MNIQQNKQQTINIRPQLPTLHGLLNLEVTLEKETITSLVPRIGYLHRCFEKYAEQLTFPQIIPYVDRTDYTVAMNNEFAYVMGVEQMLGIADKIPKRVEYIRVLIAELNRIASHLLSIGSMGMAMDKIAKFSFCFQEREKILSLFEQASGARLLYNYIWIGGLFYDVPLNFEKRCLELADYFETTLLPNLERIIREGSFLEKTVGIGILILNDALQYGVTGPILRACGLGRDLRKVDNYSIYAELEFGIPVATGQSGGVLGDTWSRCFIRIAEIQESIHIVKQCVRQLLGSHKRTTDFDPRGACPKRCRPTAQEYYARSENPRGELAFFFVTQGNTDIPYRLKVRTPSFSNLKILPLLAQKNHIATLPIILASLDLVVGEIDR
ncbi:MAG: NADH-quinone oxidoreductase subunit D [Bacteroidia bacterium]|nr:NADH-quinone oxidoreductase subunit D [Bacteroidia bacterium]